MDELTDEQLLAAHIAGDNEAFGVLFTRHRDRLWAVAVRTMRHREDAADALQDALISAFRRADTFRGQAAVTSWLHRIVVNACLDRIRANKVRRAEPIEPGDDRIAELAAPVDETASSDLSAVVTQALSELNADQRAALVLVDMQGYSVEDAALALGCAPGTIKSRCSRGRARLARKLGWLRDGGNREDD